MGTVAEHGIAYPERKAIDEDGTRRHRACLMCPVLIELPHIADRGHQYVLLQHTDLLSERPIAQKIAVLTVQGHAEAGTGIVEHVAKLFAAAVAGDVDVLAGRAGAAGDHFGAAPK